MLSHISVILVPPSIDTQSASDGNLTVVLDNKLLINCPVTGIPLPKITWYKDNGIIGQNKMDLNITISANGRQLQIARAQVSDVGLYRCIGTNDAGNTTKDFNVDVHGKLSSLSLCIHILFYKSYSE